MAFWQYEIALTLCFVLSARLAGILISVAMFHSLNEFNAEIRKLTGVKCMVAF